jgi:hypothetical protein
MEPFDRPEAIGATEYSSYRSVIAQGTEQLEEG